MKHFTGNHEQISLESIKPQALQRQRQIIRRRRHWGLEADAEDVDWPEVEIFHALPEETWGEWFSVVHGGFGRVFADDAVYHYFFFSLGEPAFLSAEPAGCGGWGGGHEDVGEEADD